MEIKINCGNAGMLVWKLPDKLVASYKKSNLDESRVVALLVMAFEKPMQQFAHVLAAITNTRDSIMLHATILDLGAHLALCAERHIKRLRGKK